jgi:hypothetical protein
MYSAVLELARIRTNHTVTGLVLSTVVTVFRLLQLERTSFSAFMIIDMSSELKLQLCSSGFRKILCYQLD